jgi:AraC-like DNA-binding protein
MEEYRYVRIPRVISIDSVVTVFNKLYEPDFRYAGEYHDFWELQCVLSGRAGICSEDNIYSLCAGQLVLHRPMAFHSVWTEGGDPLGLGVISFRGSVAADTSRRLYNVPDDCMHALNELFRDAPRIFNMEDIEVGGIRDESSLDAQRFLSRLELLLATVLATEAAQGRDDESIGVRNFRLIHAAIAANIERRLTVADIAKLCSMSESNVKKVFSKYAGCGLIEYCNKAKIVRAKELLASGMSVGEVADALGFDNQNYFSTVFKRIAGIPPSRFR